MRIDTRRRALILYPENALTKRVIVPRGGVKLALLKGLRCIMSGKVGFSLPNFSIVEFINLRLIRSLRVYFDEQISSRNNREMCKEVLC